MKKLRILSIMLALIILSSAFAIVGNAYTNTSAYANIKVIDTGDSELLNNLELIDLSLSNNNPEFISDGNFATGFTDVEAQELSDYSTVGTRRYFYYETDNVTSADDIDIGTFIFRECGTLGGESIDLYIHVDRITHKYSGSLNVGYESTGMAGKIPLLMVTDGVGTSVPGAFYINQSQYNNTGEPEHTATFTFTLRRHVETGDGPIVKGYKIYNHANDIDGSNGSFGEQITFREGHTNNFYVYSTCNLYCKDVGGYPAWGTPSHTNATGSDSFLKYSVYAETDTSGQYTATYNASKWGTTIAFTQSASSVISKKVALTYDANVEQGGYFSSDSTKATTSKQYGEYDVSTAAATETVTGATGEYAMSNDGYTFTGWNTKADGTGTAYAPNATITFSDDTVLYAQWEEEQDTYIVQFCYDPSANEGSKVIYTERNLTSSTYSLTSAPIPASENQYITVENGIPVIDNKVFAGWYSTAVGSRTRDASTALAQTIDLSQMEKQTVNGEEVIRFYAGFVNEGTPAQDASDTNDYGKTTLDGYALEGVQIRKANIDDPYANGNHNKVYDGLRFLTVYSNAMLTELDRVSSSAVEYGYAVALRENLGQIRNFTIDSATANDVDCTREGDRNHHYYTNYRLSTLVIKYETEAEQKDYLSKPVIARPYVEYTDANGFHRYAYDDYEGPSCSGGGCSVSMSEAIAGIEAYIQSK